MSLEQVIESRRKSLPMRRAVAATVIFFVGFFVLAMLMRMLNYELRNGGDFDFSDRVVSFVVFAPGSFFLLPFDYAALLREGAVTLWLIIFNCLFWGWFGSRRLVRD